jgi:3-oxoacyl-[acyl-carrier protein] reductase
MRLAGKVAVVTGAARGIGGGIARAFCREGAHVVLTDIRDELGEAKAVELGERADYLRLDVRLEADWERVIGRVLELRARLDVLVNNAGITMNRPFAQVTVEQFDMLFHVNIRAMYFVTQTCLPALVASRGAVINMTSAHAFEAMYEHSVYASTKGAIVALTRNLGIELALQGVRVNAIAPGAVLVENHYKIFRDLDPEAIGRNIPSGFMGEPHDIARACVFLASDDARYIRGQTWIIDGGTTSWMPFGDGYKERQAGQFGAGYVPGL